MATYNQMTKFKTGGIKTEFQPTTTNDSMFESIVSPNKLLTFKTHGIGKKFRASKTKDDVHGSILICPLSKVLMDTAHTQRLKKLKQLGCSHQTYMCATHWRFEHSLGVMHLAGEWVDAIHLRQPKLGITPKDKACVKIAGLLHDLGHGPFSHTYEHFLGEHEAVMEKGSFQGQTFDKEMYEEYLDKPEGWAHEDATLMMIDDLLRALGLEIDESNLDGPLKQIRDGFDAAQFGLWNKENANMPLPTESLMTSRDFIFVKECIIGHPLPPKGMSIKAFKASNLPKALIGRPEPHKEFLYDIVCNRYSGFDVDKIDYLARDTLRSHGIDCVKDTSKRLIEDKAFVARAECPDPSKCWKCQQYPFGLMTHLMICFPTSEASSVMNIFRQRFIEHDRLYQHWKTSCFNYMISDILLLAEPHYRMNITKFNADGTYEIMKVPISRAMMYPDAYLKLNDEIFSKIEDSDNEKLIPAKRLIERYNSHCKYERIDAHIVNDDEPWTKKLWDMEKDEIVSEILALCALDMSDNEGSVLDIDDIIIEKRQIHHGMKDKNPVDYMRFLDTDDYDLSPECLPTAKKVPVGMYAGSYPLMQNKVCVICRSFDTAKQDQLKRCYAEFINNLKSEQFSNIEFEEVPQTPPRRLFGDFVYEGSMPCVSQTPLKYEGFALPVSKRQKNDIPPSLFSKVVSQK